MEIILCVLIGYLIGSLNPSYIIAKINGFDIRKRGSQNAGASNAVILFGKSIGITCAILDILKPCIAMLITGLICNNYKYRFALTCCACIIGHVLPFYMHFKGGKGLACLGGTILLFDYRVFLIMLVIELAIALITNYICMVPITASVAFPIIYFIMTKDAVSTAILAVTCILILYKHIINIKRIFSGDEMHFSFLWNRKREIEKFYENK